LKKILLSVILLSVLISCGGRKQIEKALYSGNYDFAISNALKKLKSNKDKKRKREFIVLLEDAYIKAVESDLKKIHQFKKDKNPEYYKSIYKIYTNLDARQESIKPVLPLKVDNQNVPFAFNDYNDEIIDYRYKVSDYLADKGLDLLDTENKNNAREAFKIFNYIESINPNFENVRELMNEAHETGTDYVILKIKHAKLFQYF